MLYDLIKIPAKLAIRIYCRYIRINNRQLLNLKGPLILAVNHPNSFLDAIILATLFDQPLYSLARGDAFKKKWAARLLKSVNILPVYREREGTENLHRNYDTFDACQEIFKANGIVLIFTEALSENEWHLRPLRKGTARLALTAWQNNIPVTILPVGINYHDFHSFGKNVHLNFGEPIGEENLTKTITEPGKLLNEITSNIREQLQPMVYEIDQSDTGTRTKIFTERISMMKKMLLSLPALIGYILHAPFYWPVKNIIRRRALHSGHYDSLMVGILSLLYPIYVLLLTILFYWIGLGPWSLLTLPAAPFFAWSYIQLKPQFN